MFVLKACWTPQSNEKQTLLVASCMHNDYNAGIVAHCSCVKNVQYTLIVPTWGHEA